MPQDLARHLSERSLVNDHFATQISSMAILAAFDSA